MGKFFIDESGDGVIFDRHGRNILFKKGENNHFFMLGMVFLKDHKSAYNSLVALRQSMIADPYFSSLKSFRPNEMKTFKYFHATNDHQNVRAKVFEVIKGLDFEFIAQIVDMRELFHFILASQIVNPNYVYNKNVLYNYTLTNISHYARKEKYTFGISKKIQDVIIADGGTSNHDQIFIDIINNPRPELIKRYSLHSRKFNVLIMPSYNEIGLQIVDYCLWALQRYYYKYESMHLRSIWEKSSVYENPIEGKDSNIKFGYQLSYNHSTPMPSLSDLKNRTDKFAEKYPHNFW
ncbi:MAG: DUF3800 domain-containing protein [Candidatus Symbiobacter sp.]|nr:DUF3800 domain-containing protein [Candidatus Symbiobacter sp.]